jgi:putative ubiquitin-RnfH superfamily antitoxin RatB of RatAB toxin-antitoxin module
MQHYHDDLGGRLLGQGHLRKKKRREKHIHPILPAFTTTTSNAQEIPQYSSSQGYAEPVYQPPLNHVPTDVIPEPVVEPPAMEPPWFFPRDRRTPPIRIKNTIVIQTPVPVPLPPIYGNSTIAEKPLPVTTMSPLPTFLMEDDTPVSILLDMDIYWNQQQFLAEMAKAFAQRQQEISMQPQEPTTTIPEYANSTLADRPPPMTQEMTPVPAIPEYANSSIADRPAADYGVTPVPLVPTTDHGPTSVAPPVSTTDHGTRIIPPVSEDDFIAPEPTQPTTLWSFLPVDLDREYLYQMFGNFVAAGWERLKAFTINNQQYILIGACAAIGVGIVYYFATPLLAGLAKAFLAVMYRFLLEVLFKVGAAGAGVEQAWQAVQAAGAALFARQMRMQGAVMGVLHAVRNMNAPIVPSWCRGLAYAFAYTGGLTTMIVFRDFMQYIGQIFLNAGATVLEEMKDPANALLAVASAQVSKTLSGMLSTADSLLASDITNSGPALLRIEDRLSGIREMQLDPTLEKYQRLIPAITHINTQTDAVLRLMKENRQLTEQEHAQLVLWFQQVPVLPFDPRDHVSTKFMLLPYSRLHMDVYGRLNQQLLVLQRLQARYGQGMGDLATLVQAYHQTLVLVEEVGGEQHVHHENILGNIGNFAMHEEPPMFAELSATVEAIRQAVQPLATAVYSWFKTIGKIMAKSILRFLVHGAIYALVAKLFPMAAVSALAPDLLDTVMGEAFNAFFGVGWGGLLIWLKNGRDFVKAYVDGPKVDVSQLFHYPVSVKKDTGVEYIQQALSDFQKSGVYDQAAQSIAKIIPEHQHEAFIVNSFQARGTGNAHDTIKSNADWLAKVQQDAQAARANNEQFNYNQYLKITETSARLQGVTEMNGNVKFSTKEQYLEELAKVRAEREAKPQGIPMDEERLKKIDATGKRLGGTGKRDLGEAAHGSGQATPTPPVDKKKRTHGDFKKEVNARAKEDAKRQKREGNLGEAKEAGAMTQEEAQKIKDTQLGRDAHKRKLAEKHGEIKKKTGGEPFENVGTPGTHGTFEGFVRRVDGKTIQTVKEPQEGLFSKISKFLKEFIMTKFRKTWKVAKGLAWWGFLTAVQMGINAIVESLWDALAEGSPWVLESLSELGANWFFGNSESVTIQEQQFTPEEFASIYKKYRPQNLETQSTNAMMFTLGEKDEVNYGDAFESMCMGAGLQLCLHLGKALLLDRVMSGELGRYSQVDWGELASDPTKFLGSVGYTPGGVTHYDKTPPQVPLNPKEAIQLNAYTEHLAAQPDRREIIQKHVQESTTLTSAMKQFALNGEKTDLDKDVIQLAVYAIKMATKENAAINEQNMEVFKGQLMKNLQQLEVSQQMNATDPLQMTTHDYMEVQAYRLAEQAVYDMTRVQAQVQALREETEEEWAQANFWQFAGYTAKSTVLMFAISLIFYGFRRLLR